MRWLRTLVVCWMLLPLVTDAAHAQRPGDAGIFFVPNPTYCSDGEHRGTLAFLSFDMYVVSFTLVTGMEAYEFGVVLPPAAVVSGGRILPAGAADFGTGEDNWIVGTGGICQGRVGTFLLAKYAGVVLLAAVAEDTPICMIGAQPSSFPSGGPGYLACASPGELHTFTPAYDGCSCALLNPHPTFPGEGAGTCCIVPAQQRTFGGLKASYQ